MLKCPFPASTLGVGGGMKLVGGSVATVPVAVYVGSRLRSPPALLMFVGG